MSATPECNPVSRGLKSLAFAYREHSSAGSRLDWLRCAERLNDDDCAEIIAASQAFPLVPPSTVGEERYPGHRQADTRKLGVNSRTKWIFEMLCDVAAEATSIASGLELTTITRAPQFVEYRPQWGRFDWHNDYSHGLPEAPRKLTLIVQLSSAHEYGGGRLQMFGPEIEDLPDERGTVIAFPSFLYHRVTPVTQGVRRALVAWVGGPRLR